MCDLSICQAALNRDPVLYLDLTETIRRKEGHLIAALPHGALAAFHSYEKDGQDLGFTMFADDLPTAKRLLAMLPSQPDFLTVHEDFYLDELKKRFGFGGLNPCWQAGYLRTTPPPAPSAGTQVHRLDLSHLPIVEANYNAGSSDDGYLSQLISWGELYGAFEGDTLMGFIGRHAEGSIGLLQVLPQYRRRGLANLDFARRDLTALPDPDGAFDAVIAANVLHLLPDPEQAVRELWRVTAPGGRLLLPTYLQGKTGAAYGTMVRIYQGVGFHYEHAFTSETYQMLLESLNLAPVLVEVIPGRVPEGIAVLEKSI